MAVSTVGWTHEDRRIQLRTLLLAPIVFLFVLFLTAGGPATDTAIKLSLAAAVVAFTDLVEEEIISVRRVEVDESGVVFCYPLHRERTSWKELSPSRNPPKNGMWGLIRPRTESRGSRGYRITVEQSRAILSHPACPEWPLDPGLRTSLGLGNRDARVSLS